MRNPTSASDQPHANGKAAADRRDVLSPHHAALVAFDHGGVHRRPRQAAEERHATEGERAGQARVVDHEIDDGGLQAITKTQDQARIVAQFGRHDDFGAASIDVDQHRATLEQFLKRPPLVAFLVVIVVERSRRRYVGGDLTRDCLELGLVDEASIECIAGQASGTFRDPRSHALDGALATRGVAQHGAVSFQCAQLTNAPAAQRRLDIAKRRRNAMLNERRDHRL